MSEFYFTQTSVKDLEREETCPFRWKAQWLDGEIKSQPNEHTEKGSYFEYLVLGSGAVAGAEAKDMARLKNGSKSAEQLRIEEQAERVKGMLFDSNHPEFLGFTSILPQVELKSGNKKGTLDFAARDSGDDYWFIDLKLTADLSSDRTKYGWGNSWDEMDLIQMAHYQDLYFEVYNIRPRVGILVVDYSTKKRAEFGEIVISEDKIGEKNFRFSKAEEVVNLYNKNGWVKTPNVKECASCPLKCSDRINESKLVKKIVYY
jgi:hypothetical protein